MTSIHVRIVGKGKPVVFLHGFLESSTMWEYLDFPQEKFQCIYVDIPGHGKSKTIEGKEPSIVTLAKTIISNLITKDIHEFDLVGHSMGGYVALEIARQLKFIPKVILLNSNFWDDSTEKKSNRDRVISIITRNKDLFIREAIPGLFVRPNQYQKAIDTLISEAKKITIEGITYASLAMRDRPDLTEFAQSISHALVCIQGEKDALVSEAEMAKRCSNKIPYITIPNAGHMSHIEASKMVERTIQDLLLERI